MAIVIICIMTENTKIVIVCLELPALAFDLLAIFFVLEFITPAASFMSFM